MTFAYQYKQAFPQSGFPDGSMHLGVKPLTPDAWAGLLEAAGLKEILAKTYALDTQDEAKGILRRYGLGGMLGVMGRMLLLYARSPAYREFVKGVRQSGVIPANLEEYCGYVLFVGRK